MSKLPILTLLTLLLHTYAQRRTCGSVCRFKLCNVASRAPAERPRRLNLRPPLKVPNGPVICFSDSRDTLGRIKKTAEPILELRDGSDVELSKWRPSGLSPAFADKFFLTKEVKPYVKSGVVKKANRGNQQDYLDNLCLRLPIREWEVVDKKRKVVRTERGGDEGDCLAFETRALEVLVELNWEGRDDLDLIVVEPDGDELSRFNVQTEGGRFGFDSSERCFKKQLTGKETASYRMVVERGTYKAVVKHFENCNRGSTKWNLRISVNGKLVRERKGKSNRDFSQVIVEEEFTV